MSNETCQINGSSNYTEYEQIALKIEIAKLVFGIVGLSLNFAFLYTLLVKKPISTTNKLLATLSAGTLLSILGTSTMIAYRLSIQEQAFQMTPFNCFTRFPGVWIYLIGDHITSQFTLLISIDFFLSLCVLDPRWKMTDKLVAVCICISLMVGCICVIATYVSVQGRKSELIDKACYQIDIMSQLNYRVNFSVMAVFSMLSLLIYGITIVVSTMRKSTLSEVRKIQCQRQAALMKHTVIVVFCTVTTQGIPYILSVVMTFNQSFLLSSITRLVYIGFHSILPIYMFYRKLSRSRWLRKQRLFVFIMKACLGPNYNDKLPPIPSRTVALTSCHLNRIQPEEVP